MTTISDLSIINAAATRTGNLPVTAILTDGGPVAQIALNNYEESVKTELALYPWKRATKIEQLDRIDPDVHGDPPEPWTAAYQLPPDLVEIRTVKVLGYPINYEVHGDKILCDADEASEVILHYIWRAPESDWPPWFREGMIRRWEAILLRGVGERYSQADERDKAAAESFARARNRDSQAQTPRDPTVSPLLRARTGAPHFIRNPEWPWG
jgi:hypothetical protein